jgi:hypothetical protein
MSRICATIRWEDSARGPLEVFLETADDFESSLSHSAHPFLVASVMPAMKHGERRIRVEGGVCPMLRDGLQTNMQWLRQWWGPQRRPVPIESTERYSTRRVASRTGVFMSGGVDSLATLRWNRLNFSPETSGSMHDGLWVFGFEIEDRTVFERLTQSMMEIASDAQLTLIQVFTNVRSLDDDWVFWRDEAQGAYLSSVAHAFAPRFSSVSIAGTFDVPNMRPWGSHPLLDPNYSTPDLRVHHDGVAWSRLTKTQLVAGWGTALANLRVCNRSTACEPGVLNCGRCEKCIRTMLALIALGVLAQAPSFPERDVSPSMVTKVTINDPYVESCYRDLLGPLRVKGREDLARAVTSVLDSYQNRGTQTWRTRVARFDQRYLAGRLAALKSGWSGSES